MFGLMRPVKSCSSAGCCNSKDAHYQQHRLHYCGTCKTIGQQYGHKARFALNYDAVFMSELLTILNEDDTQAWGGALQAVNRCFTMPEASEEMPISLQYAAASNVFLAELKLDDNIKDKAKKRYKFARWFLSQSFKKANNQLENWGLDTQFFWSEVAEQSRLEQQQKADFGSLAECLEHYASPTAKMTAALFAHSAEVLGKPALKTQLHQLGENFGKLMYALDAFEDLEKDIFQHQFNPLVLFYKSEQTLQSSEREACRAEILQLQEQVSQHLGSLPIAADTLESYQARLLSNISLRLYAEREIPLTFAQKMQRRWQNAQQAADRWLCQPQSWGRRLQYQLVSVAFFLLPQLSVELSQQERSQVLGWFAIFTALLASIGLYKSAIAPIRKKQGLWQRFKSLFRKRKKSDPCITALCECCCQACVDGTCQFCCEACTDDDGCCNCGDWTRDDWRVFLWIMGILIALCALIYVLVFLLQ